MRRLFHQIDFGGRPDVFGEGGGDKERMRRALERVGGLDQHEIDRKTAPVHFAQIGDRRDDVAPEHIDGDGIADLQPEPVGDFFFHRDERRPRIVLGPPLS